MGLQLLAFFSWALLLASAGGCLYLVFASRAVGRFAARPAPEPAPPASPPATILKPLHGEDASLADNLRSFIRQDHPAFQIVFGTASAEDPAVPVVHRLLLEFSQADLALVTEPRQHGANLKIANLSNMLPTARYDILVLADSDMRVTADYLAAVTAPLAHDPRIGLVTCLYRAISTGGLWSDLAALHINQGFLPQAVVADALGRGAGCFGATMVLRRETLAAIGGFEALADLLADDYALGAAVRRLGLDVVLSPYLVDDIVAEASFIALFRHELRWARTVRLLAPAGFAGSIITLPVPLGLLALALAPSTVATAMLGLALVIRALTARQINRYLRLGAAPLWLLPLRDLLSFAVFLASFLGRKVAWRDRFFRIGPEGQLIVEASKSP
jgi:ceramide glucosyltransferase